MKTYNVEALTSAADKFLEITTTEADFKGSFFMVEQYSVQAVQEIDENTTAVPNRDHALLL